MPIGTTLALSPTVSGKAWVISKNTIFSPPTPTPPQNGCKKSTASKHVCEITQRLGPLRLGPSGPNPTGYFQFNLPGTEHANGITKYLHRFIYVHKR